MASRSPAMRRRSIAPSTIRSGSTSPTTISTTTNAKSRNWPEAGAHWTTSRDAGIAGGGMFCDDGATGASFHEICDRNCGGNIYRDSSSVGQGPTVARFDHLTNVGALDVGCKEPGPGVRIDRGEANAPDSYSFVNAIFWGNAPRPRFSASAE